jgi:hypothetical protein
VTSRGHEWRWRALQRRRRGGLKAGNGSVENFLGQEERRTDSTTEEHKLTIRESEGKSSYGQTKTANDGSKSHLGAKEVFLSERQAAEDAIQRQEVPPGYREYIRKYFEGIQPDEH